MNSSHQVFVWFVDGCVDVAGFTGNSSRRVVRRSHDAVGHCATFTVIFLLHLRSQRETAQHGRSLNVSLKVALEKDPAASSVVF